MKERIKSLEKVMPGFQNVARVPQEMIHTLGRKATTIVDLREDIASFAVSAGAGKVNGEMIACLPRWDSYEPILRELQDTRRLESTRAELVEYQKVKTPFYPLR